MKVLIGSNGIEITVFSLSEGAPIPILTLSKEEALEVADMLQKLAQPKRAQPVIRQPVPDPIDLTKPTPWVKPNKTVPRSPWGPPYDPNSPWGPNPTLCDSKDQPKMDTSFLPPPEKDDDPPTVEYTNPCYSD